MYLKATALQCMMEVIVRTFTMGGAVCTYPRLIWLNTLDWYLCRSRCVVPGRGLFCLLEQVHTSVSGLPYFLRWSAKPQPRGLASELGRTLLNRPYLFFTRMIRQSYIPFAFVFYPPGQPINLAASGLWHVDQHGGTEPSHQSADQDPGGRVWPGVPRGEAPAYLTALQECCSGNTGENSGSWWEINKYYHRVDDDTFSVKSHWPKMLTVIQVQNFLNSRRFINRNIQWSIRARVESKSPSHNVPSGNTEALSYPNGAYMLVIFTW